LPEGSLEFEQSSIRTASLHKRSFKMSQTAGLLGGQMWIWVGLAILLVVAVVIRKIYRKK
jgi:hypothetical protein